MLRIWYTQNMTIASQLAVHLTSPIPALTTHERDLWVTTAAMLMAKANHATPTEMNAIRQAARSVPQDLLAIMLINQNDTLTTNPVSRCVVQDQPKTEMWLETILETSRPFVTWPLLAAVLGDALPTQGQNGVSAPQHPKTWASLLAVLAEQSGAMNPTDGSIPDYIWRTFTAAHQNGPSILRHQISAMMDELYAAVPNHQWHLWQCSVKAAPAWAAGKVHTLDAEELKYGLYQSLEHIKSTPPHPDDILLARALIAANQPWVCEHIAPQWAARAPNTEAGASIVRWLLERARKDPVVPSAAEKPVAVQLALSGHGVVLKNVMPSIITPTSSDRKGLVAGMLCHPDLHDRDKGVSVDCLRAITQGMTQREAPTLLRLVVKSCQDLAQPWHPTVDECVGMLWAHMAPGSRQRLLAQHPKLLACPSVRAHQDKIAMHRAVADTHPKPRPMKM